MLRVAAVFFSQHQHLTPEASFGAVRGKFRRRAVLGSPKKQQPHRGLESPLVRLAPHGVLRLNGLPRAIPLNVVLRGETTMAGRRFTISGG
jgi:hypothetical protein